MGLPSAVFPYDQEQVNFPRELGEELEQQNRVFASGTSTEERPPSFLAAGELAQLVTATDAEERTIRQIAGLERIEARVRTLPPVMVHYL